MAQRVTLRKRTPYNTTSARRRVVKTPGGKLVVHHLKKLAVSSGGVFTSNTRKEEYARLMQYEMLDSRLVERTQVW